MSAPTLYGITAELEQALAINEEQFVAKAEDDGHAILNLKVMEEQYAAKLAKEAAELFQIHHIEQEEEGGDQ